MVQFHLSKNFGGLLKGTSCNTDFLCSLLDSNIYFLIVTLTLLKRKRGHTGFQTRPPEWVFIGLPTADISISFRPSRANTKDVQGKKEQDCHAVTCTCVECVIPDPPPPHGWSMEIPKGWGG